MNAHISQPTSLAQSRQTVHFLGSLLTFRARTVDTNGSFTVIESLSAPGAGAPLHRQQDEEAFLVTEGSFEFIVDGTVRDCGPGDFVHVRPGAVHAFRNSAATPSKMLIFNLPGGQHEAFFLAAGEPVAFEQTVFPPMGQPDFGQIVGTAQLYGIEILPPQAA